MFLAPIRFLIALVVALASPLCCCQVGLFTGHFAALCTTSTPAPVACHCCEHDGSAPAPCNDRRAPAHDPCNDCPSCYGTAGWLPYAHATPDLRPSATVIAILPVADDPVLDALTRLASPRHAAAPSAAMTGRDILRRHCALTL